MKTKKLLSILLALVMVVSMLASLGISASAAKAANSTTFDMKVNRNRVCSCSSGKVQGICPDCNPLTQASCTTCGGTGVAETDCTECGGKGVKTWTDTISVTVTGELKVGSKLTAVNNTSSVPVTFTFDNGSSSVIANPYTVQASDVGQTMKLYCEANSDKWDNMDNAVELGKVAPNNDCWLDLEASTTDILDNKQLDQNYNLTVNEVNGDDVTKVKLSWEIKDINATRTDNMVWDTENLCWKADSSSTTKINQVGTAKFTLENYSSVKLDATASFKAEAGFKGTAAYDVTNGKVTLDTANGSDTYSKTNVPKAVINATITTDAEDFNDLSATTTAVKYGTYTVTLSKSLPTTFVFAGFFDGTAGNATVNGMNASALSKYMVDNGMISDASEFDSVLVKSTYYSKLQKQNITDSKALSLLFGTTHQEFETVTRDDLLGDNDYTSDKSFATYFNGSFTWDGSAFVKNS